jgi:hypothetical protein
MVLKSNARITSLHCDGPTGSIVLIAAMTTIASSNPEHFINVTSAIIKLRWLQERSLKEQNYRFASGFWLFISSHKRKMVFQRWSYRVNWAFRTMLLGE